MERESGSFIWDLEKELDNICKHGIDFVTACKVFKDVRRKIYIDSKHSKDEERFFCIGKVEDRILTVRFTYRGYKIRIFGAGYWRKGEIYYEREDNGFK
ncbi:MAG: BrnT family toxin [Candidatus Omnitrophota bacterium]|nr:BrnT family toxin [Candidatus Omnitrophota bacterium]